MDREQDGSRDAPETTSTIRRPTAIESDDAGNRIARPGKGRIVAVRSHTDV